MKLASLDDIVHLKVDHKAGSLVNVATGKKVTLTPFRIVYARYGKKLFTPRQDGSWRLMCSSPDAVAGAHISDGEMLCGSSVACTDCKPFLTMGLRTEKGSLAVLEVSASVARDFADRLSAKALDPVPVFNPCWRIQVALTQKSSDMTYAQVVLREIHDTEAPVEECMEARRRLIPVVDQKVDRAPSTPARPALGGATLKM